MQPRSEFSLARHVIKLWILTATFLQYQRRHSARQSIPGATSLLFSFCLCLILSFHPDWGYERRNPFRATCNKVKNVLIKDKEGDGRRQRRNYLVPCEVQQSEEMSETNGCKKLNGDHLVPCEVQQTETECWKANRGRDYRDLFSG